MLLPANFEKKKRDFFQNTHMQTLLFLLDNYEILLLLSKQLQHFSRWDNCPCEALRKQ